MTENYRLASAPVFVIDLRAVLGCDRSHNASHKVVCVIVIELGADRHHAIGDFFATTIEVVAT